MNHMGWYRRYKIVFDAFRDVGSKLVSKTSTQCPVHRVPSNSFSSFYNPCKSCGILRSPSISSKFGYLNGLKHNESSLISAMPMTRRYYHVDRKLVHNFWPGGFGRWFQSPKNVLVAVLFGSGAVISIYFWKMEVVPIVSKNIEIILGESQFKEINERKLLPATHPNSIRVKLIAKDIIDALQRGLTKEEELFYDKLVKESRRQGEKQGAKPSTHHLEGLNWEVLVVDEPLGTAFCLPGGKIVVCTGLLKHLQTNAEIATIIGHEVGLAVARHFAKHNSKNLGLVITRLVLYGFLKPDVVDQMSNLLLTLPISQKMEREADYIGLLLMASAGYDPRVALNVYEKLGKLGGGDLVLGDYLSTYPSGMKRAKLLARAEVMEEALSIYRQSASRGAASQLINS